MKRIFLLIPFHFFFLCSFSQESVTLKGKIGKYEIEMQLEKSEEGKPPIKGKYRYQGKEDYLKVNGALYGNKILNLAESYKGDVTGEFFLEKSKEGNWSGKWIGLESAYDVNLISSSGDPLIFRTESLEERSKKTNEYLTGSYRLENYFLNDTWFTKENPSVEIGFDGGTVTVKELDENSIAVNFNLVRGPTYHIADFDGEAVKINENTFEYKGKPYDQSEGEDCHLVFEFKNKILTITQKSWACGFGARAHANGDFIKISDK